MNTEAHEPAASRPPPDQTSLCVVVPAFNEQDVLPEFHLRLKGVLGGLPGSHEIIYINDGSSDRSAQVIHELMLTDRNVTLLDLSRNFGKEIALTAGLDQADADAVVVIDCDLQDPPELIPQLLDQWRAGYDVVYAQRLERSGEPWLKKFSAYAFYRIIGKLASIDIPADVGDYRLLSRRALQALHSVREQHRYMKGLFAWIGFPQTAVGYRRDARFAGRSSWNYWRLWEFALEGITSFTTRPLKLATYIGMLTAVAAFIFGVYIILDKLLYDNPVPGYPSLMVVVLFLGGVQLITLGIIGEYLARIFGETKQRPLYLIKELRKGERT